MVMCRLIAFFFVKTNNNCPKTRDDYRSVSLFFLFKLYKFVWLQTKRFCGCVCVCACGQMGLTYRFPVIVISFYIFVGVFRSVLQYQLFHLKEHIMLVHASPLARRIFEMCSQFVILLISKDMEHWKTDFQIYLQHPFV
jgi:uncharacterized membrane protein